MNFRFDRRRFPPLNALIAFEAAARLGSFAEAGEEIHLTASAISRQVKALEEHLGMELFERVRQRVYLTEQGRLLAVQVRQTLGRLMTVSDQASQLRTAARTLNIGVLPTFADYWLIPRLPGFVRAHPNVMLNLVGVGVGFDYEAGGLDAVLHTNAKVWAEAVAHKVGDEEFIAVASPEWIAEHGVAGPADLTDKTLLENPRRPYLWIQWFQQNDVELHALLREFRFSQYSMVFQAAIASLGAALLPRLLAQGELDAGRLVAIPAKTLSVSAGYFLVHPLHREQFAPLRDFRDWLLSQAPGAAPSVIAPSVG